MFFLYKKKTHLYLNFFAVSDIYMSRHSLTINGSIFSLQLSLLVHQNSLLRGIVFVSVYTFFLGKLCILSLISSVCLIQSIFHLTHRYLHSQLGTKSFIRLYLTHVTFYSTQKRGNRFGYSSVSLCSMTVTHSHILIQYCVIYLPLSVVL